MAKVFLDVGGFKGHSSLAALDPIFGFDRIFCFEPCPEAAKIIRQITDNRLVVDEAALSNRDGASQLFNSGSLGASLFKDAPDYQPSSLQTDTAFEWIQTIDVARFISAYTASYDEIWIKLNCEGSELDIITSIIKAGLNGRIANSLIDLDAKKIPSLQAKWQSVMALVKEIKMPYSLPEDVQYHMVTNYGGIHNWLLHTKAAKETPQKRIKSLAYNLQIFLKKPECNGYHKKLLLDRFPVLRYFARSRGDAVANKTSL